MHNTKKEREREREPYFCTYFWHRGKKMMKSPVAEGASQPAHRPTGNLSMAWGVSSMSLMLPWGVLFVAELLHILL